MHNKYNCKLQYQECGATLKGSCRPTFHHPAAATGIEGLNFVWIGKIDEEWWNQE
jgi:hypothetical protein